MADPEQFAAQYAPLATKVGDQLGVSPDLLLSQWGMETGWGKSVIPGTNNLGNIMDFSGGGVSAVDNYNGRTDKYRAFETPDAFGEHFVDLIRRRYPSVVGSGSDAVKFATALKQGGYAEHPEYVNSIINGTNYFRQNPKAMQILANVTTSDANPVSTTENPFASLNEEFRLGVPDSTQQANPFDALNSEFALPKSEPYVAPPTPKQPTTGESVMGSIKELPRQIGLTTRYGMEGLGDVGSMLLAPFQVPMNAASQALGGPPVASLRQMATAGANAIGLPEPQGKLENVVGDVTRGMTGAATGTRLAGLLTQGMTALAPTRLAGLTAPELAAAPAAVSPTVTQKVIEQLAQAPVMQTIAGGTASGAGSTTKAFGGGPAAEFGATVAGALAPGGASAAAGKTYKLGQSAIQPLYEGGRNQILANVLRNVIPEDRVGDIVEKLTAAKSLVPGSMPTAAEVAESGGIGALQRSAAAAFPEPYTQRGLEQNAARVQALRGVAGDEASLAAAELARKTKTQPLYEQAKQSTAQVDSTRVVNLIDRLSAKNSGRPQLVKELNQIRETLFEPYPAQQRGADAWKQLDETLTKRMSDADSDAVRTARTVMDRIRKGSIDAEEGLAQLKGLSGTSKTANEAIDYARAQLKTPDYVLRDKPQNIISSIGGIKDILATTENPLLKRELLTVKRALENQLSKVEPSFKTAEQNFAQLSQPINQMQIGQELLNKMQPALADYGALGSETAAKYALALRNADQTAKTATGFKGATLERTMTPEQMGTLNSVAQDLARKTNAQNLGRGPGSDTFQKLSMANMAQQVGMPIGLVESVGKIPAIGGYLTRIYGEADTLMQQALAKALLDPQATAKLIAQANPADRSRLMADALRGTLTPSSFMNQ
jgi:hypothetical protein